MVLRIQRYARIVVVWLWIVMPSLVTIGCVSYPRPYPWNFPEAREWNQPLEFSWVNAVDNYRNIKSSKGKLWNPFVQEYEPDFGGDLYPDSEEHEMYQ